MYGVRVKYKDNKEWSYANNSLILSKSELQVSNKFSIEEFFMSDKEATKLMLNLCERAKNQDGYFSYGRNFEAIAKIEFNSTYKPYTERAVVEYLEL